MFHCEFGKEVKIKIFSIIVREMVGHEPNMDVYLLNINSKKVWMV